VAIGPDESAGELHDRLSQAGARTVLQTVRLIEQGKAKPFRQDNSLATRAPKIFKDDCRIDWKKTAMQIYNFIRGLSPYPAAWTTHKGRILKLYRSSLVGSRSAGSGIVCLRSDDALHIGSGDGVVSILEIQLEGKRRLGIEEFLRGYRIEEGESFD
jgi:methionyl-tRNA formyltransferase